MVDHLTSMGIQRWQRREITSPKITVNDLNVKEKGERKIEDQPTNKTSNFSVDLAAEVQGLSAYAAVSVRKNKWDEDSFWLWVVPQASLPAAQLQLLDKMVTATSSAWQGPSVADNYLEGNKLNLALEKNLTAIIILSEKVNWPALYEHPLYSKQQCLLASSLSELQSDVEKKRTTWHSLQQLMEK